MKLFFSLLAVFAMIVYISTMTLDSSKKGCACNSEDINGNCLNWICGKRETKGCACDSEDINGNCLHWICEESKGCACTSMSNGVCLSWNCNGK